MQLLISAKGASKRLLFEEKFCDQISYLKESQYTFQEEDFGELNTRVIHLGKIIIVSGTYLLKDSYQPFFHEEEGLRLSNTKCGEFSFVSPCYNSCPFLSVTERNNCKLMKQSVASDYPKNTQNSFINISFSIAYFEELVSRYPQIFQKFYDDAKREKSMLCHQNVQTSLTMSKLIRSINAYKIKTSCCKLNLEIKVIGLLNLVVEDLVLGETALPQAFKIDINQIKEARELLLADIKNPPAIKKLARMVGTNEFKLKKGFKELYQTTIYGALLDYKMQQACDLLQGKQWSITQISDQVGYSHPAHFINAFKRKFGITPNKSRNTAC